MISGDSCSVVIHILSFDRDKFRNIDSLRRSVLLFSPAAAGQHKQ